MVEFVVDVVEYDVVEGMDEEGDGECCEGCGGFG